MMGQSNRLLEQMSDEAIMHKSFRKHLKTDRMREDMSDGFEEIIEDGRVKMIMLPTKEQYYEALECVKALGYLTVEGFMIHQLKKAMDNYDLNNENDGDL